jgi:mRNA interferase RelE/StbE
MTYQIFFTDKASKQLKKLEKKDQERIINSLGRIRIRPETHVTKLVGDPGYKLRVGNFRVILDIEKEKLIILFLLIGHRKNIYEKI